MCEQRRTALPPKQLPAAAGDVQMPSRRAWTPSYQSMHRHSRLVLVATRRAAATRLLELAALGADVGLDVRVRSARRAKVLGGLAVRHRALEQHARLGKRIPQRELVKSEALA